ncbi:MAG: hypothetical protein FP815_03610 [Desulfobulbaceae bacterium]|nr:hypothetical protein [Desulfobulbaceae bacterium]
MEFTKKITDCLVGTICVTLGPIVTAANAELTGKHGYVMIGNSTKPPSWHTWKTELGTVDFQSGTMTTIYKESADFCPDSNYCQASATESWPYTSLSTNVYSMLDGVMGVASNTENAALLDGAQADTRALMFGVKLDTQKLYTNTDAQGQFFTLTYERDFLGESKGQNRVSSMIMTMDGIGNATGTETLACNGTACTNGYISSNPFAVTYNLKTGGVLNINSADMGFISSDGKIAIISNPPTAYPDTADDFMLGVSIKKGDKVYSSADLQGQWIFSTFGDEGGAIFSEFGSITCDSLGSCQFDSKYSQGGVISYDQMTMSIGPVAADGSINGFTVAQDKITGAIGASGTVMIFTYTTQNERLMGIAVKSDATLPSLGVILKRGSWNLAGLTSGQEKSISQLISGKESQITSIWKWVDNTTWGVYLPSAGATQTASYASSKGFEVITSIKPGEGFWVNVAPAQPGETESLILE